MVYVSLAFSPTLDLPSRHYEPSSRASLASPSTPVQDSSQAHPTLFCGRSSCRLEPGAFSYRQALAPSFGVASPIGSFETPGFGSRHRHVQATEAALEVCLRKAKQSFRGLLWILRQALVGSTATTAGQTDRRWVARRQIALPAPSASKAQESTDTGSSFDGGPGWSSSNRSAMAGLALVGEARCKGGRERQARYRFRFSEPRDGVTATHPHQQYAPALLGGLAGIPSGSSSRLGSLQPPPDHQGAARAHISGGSQPEDPGGIAGPQDLSPTCLGGLPSIYASYSQAASQRVLLQDAHHPGTGKGLRRQACACQDEHSSPFCGPGSAGGSGDGAGHACGGVRGGSGGPAKRCGGCDHAVSASASESRGTRYPASQRLQASQREGGRGRRFKRFSTRCGNIFGFLIAWPHLGRPSALDGDWNTRPIGLSVETAALFGELPDFRHNRLLAVQQAADFKTPLQAVHDAALLAMVVQRNLLEAHYDCLRSPSRASGAKADGQCFVEPGSGSVAQAISPKCVSFEFPEESSWSESGECVQRCTVVPTAPVPSSAFAAPRIGDSLGVAKLRTDEPFPTLRLFRSCLCRPRAPVPQARKVSFSFAVQFWFPAPTQLELPRIQALPQRSVPPGTGVELQSPFGCHEGNRLLSVPFQPTGCHAGSGPLVDKQDELEGCFPSPYLGSLEVSVLGRRARQPVQRFNLGAAPYTPPSRRNDPPMPRGDLANSNAIHSFPSAGLLAAISSGISTYTCLELVRGTDIRRRGHYWDEQHCIVDAKGSSTLPNPSARVLIHTLPAFPTPQIIVCQTAMLWTHRAVAVVYEEAPMEPYVCDIPRQDSIRNFLHAQALSAAVPRQPWVRLFRTGTVFSCEVNGRPVSCDALVPPDTDVIRLSVPHLLQPLPANPQNDTRTRPPTPPIPSGSEDDSSSSDSEDGLSVRHQPEDATTSQSAYPALPPPVLSCARPGRWRLPWAVDIGRPVDSDFEGVPSRSLALHSEEAIGQFTVFDIYRNARVLPLPVPISEKALINVALQATPELPRPFEFRFLRYTLEHWPEPQLVIHARLPTDQIVVPLVIENPFSGLHSLPSQGLLPLCGLGAGRQVL